MGVSKNVDMEFTSVTSHVSNSHDYVDHVFKRV
jgi:hypothetical protein